MQALSAYDLTNISSQRALQNRTKSVQNNIITNESISARGMVEDSIQLYRLDTELEQRQRDEPDSSIQPNMGK